MRYPLNMVFSLRQESNDNSPLDVAYHGVQICLCKYRYIYSILQTLFICVCPGFAEVHSADADAILHFLTAHRLLYYGGSGLNIIPPIR